MNARRELYELVSCIVNDEIRQFTLDMLEAAPVVFWTEKASKNHHPKDERGPQGNLIHTVRVIKLARIMASGCPLDQIVVDVITSAASLHDTGRHGLYGLDEHTVSNHPFLVRELARSKGLTCPYIADILTLIERHMGKWGDPEYFPEVTPSAILHLADMVSANAEKVWGTEKMEEISWAGDIPFKDQGMDEDKMSLFEELAEDNEYWKSALKFVKQVSSRKLSSLTDNQRGWLQDIIASLTVELNRKTAREVFEEQ